MTDATLSTDELATSTATIDPTGAASAADAADPEALEPDAPSETEQDSEAGEGPDLQLAGGTLNDEELAAVTAVLGTLAGASGMEHNGAGTAGPTDRTLQRRRRLGLWGRPGADSWKHAAGLR